MDLKFKKWLIFTLAWIMAPMAPIAPAVAADAEKPLFCITGMAHENRNPDRDFFFLWSQQGNLTLYRPTKKLSMEPWLPNEGMAVNPKIWGKAYASAVQVKKPIGDSVVQLRPKGNRTPSKLEIHIDEESLTGYLALNSGNGKPPSQFAMHCAHAVIQ